MILTAKVKENRLEYKDWFIYINLSMSRIESSHKSDGRNMHHYSIEEAIDAIEGQP